MSRSFRIRRAEPSDAPAISRLLRRLTLRYIAPGEPLPAVRDMLQHVGIPAVRQRLAAPDYRFHVAVDGRSLLGVVGMRDDSHLYHLFVTTRHQRRGVGRALWQTALRASREAADPPHITVNASRYAVPVYRRLGFVDDPEPGQVPGGIHCIPMRYACRERDGRA